MQVGDFVEVYNIEKLEPKKKDNSAKYTPKSKELKDYNNYIIEDNKNGLLFNDLDYNNLSKKIIFFYKMNYNEKLNLILNARDKIEKEYNVKNIIRIYREALMKSD